MIAFGNYAGTDVTVDDRGWFCASCEGETFRTETLAALHTLLDKATAPTRKARAKLNLAVVALTASGTVYEGTLFGIHGTTGRPRMVVDGEKVSVGDYGGVSMWPATAPETEQVREIGRALVAAREAVRKIEGQIETALAAAPYRHGPRYGSRGQENAEATEQAMFAALQQAAKLDPEFTKDFTRNRHGEYQ